MLNDKESDTNAAIGRICPRCKMNSGYMVEPTATEWLKIHLLLTCRGYVPEVNKSLNSQFYKNEQPI